MSIDSTSKRYVIRIKAIYFIVLIIFLQLNCNIKKPVAPQWDVQLNLPLVNRPYSIDSLIKKDPELFQINPQNGLITYSFSQDIKTDSIGDKLYLQPEQPSPLSIDAGSIPYKDFSFTDFILNPGIPSGVVPPGDLPKFTLNLPPTNQFDYLEFDSGKVRLTITNYCPFTIEFVSPIVIKDRENQIYEFAITSIPPLSQQFFEISLNNRKLSVPLVLDTVNARTPGSTGIVAVPDSILRVQLHFKNLLLKSARAKIPPTEIFRIKNSRFVIDTSTNSSKLKIARFKHGVINLKIINNFDVASQINFQLPQIINRITQQFFSQERIIFRKDSLSFRINLSEYEFRSPYPTDTIHFNGSIKQLGSENDTTDFRTFNSNDQLTVNVNILPPPENKFVISYLEGVIKPTIINFDTSLSIKLGELPDKFNFDSLKLPDSKFNFTLSCPNIPIRFSGNILLADSNLYQLSIPTTTLNANTVNQIIVSGNELVSSITRYISRNKNLPEKFHISSNLIVNPNYVLGSINSSDKVNGKVHFEIPFNIGIKNGRFRDTLIIGDERDDNGNKVQLDSSFLNSVQSGTINFVLKNKIPIGIKLSIMLLDNQKRFLQYIPSSGPVIVTPSQVGTDGFSNTITQSKIIININKTEIDNINRSTYGVVDIEINTLPTTSSVKIRNIDFIQVKVFASFNYRIGENN